MFRYRSQILAEDENADRFTDSHSIVDTWAVAYYFSGLPDMYAADALIETVKHTDELFISEPSFHQYPPSTFIIIHE
jgi:hypothetical protein